MFTMFENGDELIWNAAISLGREDDNDEREGGYVIYKERTGANTATVKRGPYEFEVYLDELENPDEY